MGKPDNVIEIVLTGGPCAGKTTILAHLVSSVSELGIRVMTSPEVASLLISGGLSDIGYFRAKEPEVYERIEEQIILLQGDLRERYRALGGLFAPDPVCVIYDRAEMDAASYLPPGRAEEILRRHGSSLAQARDNYDAVIHLRTVARVGHEYYGFENPARQEDSHEALLSDDQTLDAWNGHPSLWVVEASHEFSSKSKRVLEIVKQIINSQG